MKKIISIFAALAIVLTLASCGTSAKSDDTTAAMAETSAAAKTEDSTACDSSAIRVGTLKGPTGMGMSKLMQDNDDSKTANKYTFDLETDPTTITAKLVSGELDLAALPTNAASALYNKTKGKVEMISVNTLGVLYIFDKSGTVNSVADLKGKTILTSGQGQNPEYILDYILQKNGLTVGTDVTVEFASEHAEVVTKALAGSYDVVMLPEPFATQLSLKSADFKNVIDVSAEWEKAAGSKLPMSCIAVRTDFLTANKTAVDNFLKDYKTSVDFVNNNQSEASQLIEKYDIMTAAVALKSINNCHIVFITGSEMKTYASDYLNVLAGFNAASVGGSVPGDDFYYGA